MSSSEEEQLNLPQLFHVIYKQNEARADHGMKSPPAYGIPFFFPASYFEEITTTLKENKIEYEDYSENGDRECSLVLDVKSDQLRLLISLGSDGKEIYFQSPDLLLPAGDMGLVLLPSGML